jgi:FkbM family methyltransferase
MRILKTILRRLSRRFPNAARQWKYARFNLMDIHDMYLARPLAPVMTPFGFKFGGLASQHHLAMQQGTFERAEVSLLSRLLRDSDVFVDVGANVGYFTCLARHGCKPTIAIEPLPKNLGALYANLLANGWADTEVIPMAASDTVGIQILYGASSTGASLIDNWAGALSAFRHNICVSTLDNIIGDRFEGKRLLIKMDVEGHEHPALRGARGLLSRNVKPIWLIELTFHEYHPDGHNPNFANCFEFFFELGYEVHLLSGAELKQITREDIARWRVAGKTDSAYVNYLFTPADVSLASLAQQESVDWRQ